MKRYIRSENTISEMAHKIHEAKDALAQYDEEQVEYVRECQQEIARVISDHYLDDDQETDHSWPVGPRVSQIKEDYLLGAITEGLMSEEEFEDIFDLLDIIDLEYAQAHA